jgi:hypothetical protein
VISEAYRKNLDRFAKSSLFDALAADVEMFGKDAVFGSEAAQTASDEDPE